MAQKKGYKGLEYRTGKPATFWVGFARIALLVVLIAVVWQLIPRDDVGVILSPRTSDVFLYFWKESATLLEATAASAFRITAALIVGSCVGFSLGIGLSLFRSIETEHKFIIRFLYGWPRTWMLIFGVVFLGSNATVLTGFLVLYVVLTVWFLSAQAVQDLLEGSGRSRDTVDMQVLYASTKFDLLWDYILPEVRAARFAALQLSTARMWRAMILVEAFSLPDGPGLGSLIYNAFQYFDIDAAFGTSLIVVGMVYVFLQIIHFVHRHTKFF